MMVSAITCVIDCYIVEDDEALVEHDFGCLDVSYSQYATALPDGLVYDQVSKIAFSLVFHNLNERGEYFAFDGLSEVQKRSCHAAIHGQLLATHHRLLPH